MSTEGSTPLASEAIDLLQGLMDRMNREIERLVALYVQHARLRGASPTVKEIAHLSLEAARVLNFKPWTEDAADAAKRRLAEVQELTGQDVQPLDGTAASYTSGRDLSIWYALGEPIGASTPITMQQAAYYIQMDLMVDVPRLVDMDLAAEPLLSPDVETSIRNVIREHQDFWLMPTYTRAQDGPGYVRCWECGSELSYINVAEVGSIDECVLCRGWFTDSQRKSQMWTAQRSHRASV